MRAYVVGGAVRDELLRLPVQDRDYVVVGATPEEMTAQGFRPVGRDFPVFLHPQTHEEYALARTERKSGRGYKGFTVHAAPDVTLEDDLRRRDLTINAMARDDAGRLIDPFGGERDLRAGILRHVSEAFAEDPVRILRVARFAARFAFRVAPETMALMKQMVASGEADYLVAERVWQEFAKGLGEREPQRMLQVLDESGLSAKLLPEVSQTPSEWPKSLPARFALLCWPMTEAGAQRLCDRLKPPGDVRDLALLAARSRERLLGVRTASPEALMDLLKSTDAFRRPERFAELLELARTADPSIDVGLAGRALKAALAVDAGAIAKTSPPGEIASRIDAARLQAISRAL